MPPMNGTNTPSRAGFKRRSTAAAAFQVARGQVIEHERVAVRLAGQMAPRERALNPVLAL
jgi:hypothetical protein